MKFHPQVLVVAGPSGVGKSTLIARALAANPRWMFSVSATTRRPRPGEADGKQYYFVSREEFIRRTAERGFLEYADVYGELYGTPGSELVRAAELGRHLLVEVDTVGCLSIRALKPEIPLLAILPPNVAELKRRLRERGTESGQALDLRYAQIYAELQRLRGFDYAIVNDKLEQAEAQLLNLLQVIEDGLTSAASRVDLLLSQTGGTA
jgi:guanylate kinase